MQEVDRATPFVKYISFNEARFMAETEPVLQRLARKKLIPEPLLIVVGDERSDFYMERINGPTINNLPEDVRRSTEFAVKLANLFQGLTDQNTTHPDTFIQNFMLDLETDRIVAVDVDAAVSNEDPMQKNIFDYSWVLAESVLGYEMLSELCETYDDDPENLSFINDGRDHPADDIDSEILEHFMQEAVTYLFERDGMRDKVDGRVVSFILRGLKPETAPENFDEIFALKE